MPPASFDSFFRAATGHPPYDYQCRLACGERRDRSDAEWLAAGTDCRSQLINIPTGLGKTAAVVIAWLWNRVARQDPVWPRRFVYCLPMRTLVEQTEAEAQKWIANLLAQADALGLSSASRAELKWLAAHSPVILMGGEEFDAARRDWDVYPERPAILIGTQDMLLSRALNRGYGMGRARWPMHFGLLNNDALWVLDETQLMGPGLWTSAQLDWLRQERFLSLKKCPTWWMSATIGTSFLETLDRTNAKLTTPKTVKTEDNDPAVATLFKAIRRVSIWQQTKETSYAKTGEKTSSKPENPRDAFLQSLARAILQEHKEGTLSLVVCNSVAAAQRLFALVETAAIANKTADAVKLLTSRFRPKDRKANVDVLLSFESARKKARTTGAPHQGLICVSTQVVEAGVDVSARRLWSELAPWAPLLQRLGRLNRDGRLNQDAQAVVFEVPAEQKGRAKNAEPTGPYDPADIKSAKKIVEAIAAACTSTPDTPIRELIAQLSSDKTIGALLKQSLEPRPGPFPRAMDVHGLFSTESDAFGGFTDVSPWVRGSDPNADVIVFWRDWPDAKKDPNQHDGPAFQREEGCPVAVHRLRKFVETHKQAWSWNPKTEIWENFFQNEICPGMTILLPASVGGYETALGWTGDKKSTLENLPLPGAFEDRYTDDTLSLARGHWVSLDDHLQSVANTMGQITKELSLPTPLTTALQQAAVWHDIGKSIEPWQNALPRPKPKSYSPVFWAKAPYLLKVEVAPSSKPNEANILALIAKEAPSAVLVQIESTDDKTAAYLFQIERRLTLKTLEALGQEQGVIRLPRIRAFRPGLRHESASALAVWHRYYRTKSGDFPALTIYLIAAHHGLVRTVLTSREQTGSANVCGIPIQPDHPLPWNPTWKLDFACAQDGSDGKFSEDGLSFICHAPGWTGLVADLLGGWESDAPKAASGAVPIDEPHSLNPFNLAYLEALLRGADGRASANESGRLDATQREALSRAFCSSKVSWRLPEFSWRGPGLRQYQPAVFNLTHPLPKKIHAVKLDKKYSTFFNAYYVALSSAKKKGDAKETEFERFDFTLSSLGMFTTQDENIGKEFRAYAKNRIAEEKIITRYPPDFRTYNTTKVQDNFWLTASSAPPLFWLLDGEDWKDETLRHLDACLARMTYFGRAESITEISRDPTTAGDITANCCLQTQRTATSVPVLCPLPDATLDQAQLSTDEKAVADSSTPPGAVWRFADRPALSTRKKPTKRQVIGARKPTHILQFAVGGRVFPPVQSWIRLTERFRGTVLNEMAKQASGGKCTRFCELPAGQQAEFSLLTGKNTDNSPLTDHRHASFFLIPDRDENPTRLVCHRPEPFTACEQEAMLMGSERPISWEYGNDDWQLRLVPLPEETPLPKNIIGTATIWESVTPYVPSRHIYGRNGKPKAGMSLPEQVATDLAHRGFPSAQVIIQGEVTDNRGSWIKVHRPRRLRNGHTNDVKRGYQIRLQFGKPITGPLSLGHSSHFGLGLFVPAGV